MSISLLLIPVGLSATSTISGSLTSTESSDSISSVGSVIVQGAFSAAEPNDSALFSGASVIHGNLNAIEANDSISISGIAPQGITTTLSASELSDAIAASGGVIVQGNFAASEASDNFYGIVIPILHGDMNISEVSDTMIYNFFTWDGYINSRPVSKLTLTPVAQGLTISPISLMDGAYSATN